MNTGRLIKVHLFLKSMFPQRNPNSRLALTGRAIDPAHSPTRRAMTAIMARVCCR
jgi:hypothetical protein